MSTVRILLGAGIAGADGELPHLAISDDIAGTGRKRLRFGVGIAENVPSVGEYRAALFRFSGRTGLGKARVLYAIQPRQASLRAQRRHFIRNQVFGLTSVARRQSAKKILHYIGLAA